MANQVHVFIACSLDGFIAGPNDELDWLAEPNADEPVEDTFAPFLATVGAMLMGRRTFDVVQSFGDDAWAYGDLPIRVATNRPLECSWESVVPIRGSIEEMIATTKALAGDRNVYVDGGCLIRSALDADLVDELTVTIVPILLGKGTSLFAGLRQRHRLAQLGSRPIGRGMVELRYATMR